MANTWLFGLEYELCTKNSPISFRLVDVYVYVYIYVMKHNSIVIKLYIYETIMKKFD